MHIRNLIDAIRLPFRKERELYRSFYSILGFYPRDISYYRQALMHKSVGMNVSGEKPLNNERLEFLGDAVLDAVVGEIVFHHFPGKKEGFLTTARSKVVKRETLGQVAVQLGLDKLVRYQGSSQLHNSYVAGNAFEALVGAIYLDRGYDACLQFVKKRILEHLIDLDKLAYQEVNFKSKLLEWTQKHKLTLEYDLLSEARDSSGSPVFRTRVLINGIECGRGTGFSKKESHQVASRSSLNHIKKDKKLHATLLQKNRKETSK
ncbi:MAG: ribonuclease III [Bacteroidaceae bacterium]|nr:ribonuclease III [Paraprevotella sp.]MDY2716395.1 ribonuclease III [Bacteroidaceae bacterium]